MKLAPWQSKRAGMRRLGPVGFGAFLALLLAACGVSPSHTGGNTNGSASSVILGGSGLAIRPCLGDYTGGLSPSLALSSSASLSGSARVGDIIEIRLDGQHSWTLESIKPATALVSHENKGALDRVDGACV